MLLLGRIRWDPINIHLGLATGFMLLFQGAWDPKLGVFNDWNLFANVAFPLAMFNGYNLLSEPERRHRGSCEQPRQPRAQRCRRRAPSHRLPPESFVAAANCARLPSSASIRSNRLYLQTRSVRESEPVLI